MGDAGTKLAAISIAESSRSAAYGSDILANFRQTNPTHINKEHAPAFKKLVTWLATGNASGTLPSTLKVAWTGGIAAADGVKSFTAAGIKSSSITCAFDASSTCYGTAQLLVVGSKTSSTISNAQLAINIQKALKAGKPVLYVHLDGWDDPTGKGTSIVSTMGLSLTYGGNYWANDKVGTTRSTLAQNALLNTISPSAKLRPFLTTATPTFAYPWNGCIDDLCKSVAGFETEFNTPVTELRQAINLYNTGGINLFNATNNKTLRLLALWSDLQRASLTYPMDKTANAVSFAKSYIADSLIAYIRPTAIAQTNMGTYLPDTPVVKLTPTVSAVDEIVTITLNNSDGFTAIGKYATPSQAVTVELVEAGAAQTALRLNTQRTGSTRLWQVNGYSGPQYLASPSMSLAKATPIMVSTPYGGTMQLQFSGATPGQTVTLKIKGAATHAVLNGMNGITNNDVVAFINAMQNSGVYWAEMKLPGLEIHTRTDKQLAIFDFPAYAGDYLKYFAEIQTYLVDDIFPLAGFSIAGKPLTTHVQSICTALNWNCIDSNIHRMPNIQHINVDQFSHCASGCSGNPYDQDWPLKPRGWGESHEIGHNLQNALLKVYGERSTEVSNNVFPLHKNWRLFTDSVVNQEKVFDYKTLFDVFINAKSTTSFFTTAYDRIWGNAAYAANNLERMMFYMQWVHYWADRQQNIASGWDMVTLLYLHQRQFDQASLATQANWDANKAKLGYSTYATRPVLGTDGGNDNMLIVLSNITQRDQRPTFDQWGVRYSAAAAAQVQSFNYAVEPAFFFALNVPNDHSTAKKIDMSVSSPIWATWP